MVVGLISLRSTGKIVCRLGNGREKNGQMGGRGRQWQYQYSF
jgi:hypothetical protein